MTKPQSTTIRISGATSIAESGGFTIQEDAPSHLKWSSVAPGQLLSDSQGFAYDDSAGEGITVYIADTGMDMSNPVRALLYLSLTTCLVIIYDRNI